MDDIIKEMKNHGAICSDRKTIERELRAMLDSTGKLGKIKALECVRKYEDDPLDLILIAFEDSSQMQINAKKGGAGAAFVIEALKEVEGETWKN